MRKLLSVLSILICSFIAEPCLCDEMDIGTTFSPLQCAYLNEDWQRTYKEVLDMGFDIIRLGAYWDRIEPEQGVFDFSRLDYQIQRAKESGIPVILCVGMKAPRWPEYFIPEWVLAEIRLAYGCDVSKNKYLKDKVLNFIRKTVEYYRNNKTVICWQLENEPLDRAGPKLWYIGKEFLAKEAALIRETDGHNRPILINMATYPNRFLRYLNKLFSKNSPLTEAVEICDILGLNIYPIVGNRCLGINLILRSRGPQRRRYFSDIIDFAVKKDKAVWITELQAEPWDPGKLVHKDEAEPVTCNPAQITGLFSELKSLGIKTILLWGAEYWFYRQKRFSDQRWIESAQALIRQDTD